MEACRPPGYSPTCGHGGRGPLVNIGQLNDRSILLSRLALDEHVVGCLGGPEKRRGADEVEPPGFGFEEGPQRFAGPPRLVSTAARQTRVLEQVMKPNDIPIIPERLRFPLP